MASPILFGRYHLLEKISAGGMAEVFKAKSYGVAGFEKLLVIKKILPNLNSDKEFIEMFLDEARISVSLSHGNIVQVIDLGREGESYFMAMEYVHGFDLARLLIRSKQSEELPLSLKLFLVGEVLKALDYAHRRRDREQRELNIVHCDVSPQNVLVSYEGEVKLADFGISKAAFQSASSREVVRGKYAYMSPEQVRGRNLDRRSDIFAVGVILWEMLAGRRLFKTESVEKTLKKVLEEPIPSPSQFDSTIPAELDRIVTKALTRDRDKRYLEDQDMLDDISVFMFSQNLMVTGADLSAYMKRIFATEFEKSRSDELAPGDAGRVARAGAQEVRAALFIPLGASRTVPSFRLDPANPVPSPVPLCRVSVMILVAEWNAAPSIRTTSERHKRMLELSERFQRRLEQAGGELWEVNYNSLVAIWRVEDAPRVEVNTALEVAFGLQEELKASLGEDEKPYAVLDIALHLGPVIVNVATGHPLLGWQSTRTFAIPRVMVNQVIAQGQLLATPAIQAYAAEHFRFAPFALPPAVGGRLPASLRVEVVSPADESGMRRFSPFTRYLGRESLLDALLERVREATDNRGSVLLLPGNEGSGRSRLREELRQTCRARGQAFFVVTCPTGGRHFVYAGALDLLRRLCGLSATEGGEAELRRLSRLSELGLSPEELELVRSLFDEVLPLSGTRSDQQRQSRIFTLLDKVVEGLSKDGPVVLCFEDFQSVDTLTEAWLSRLIGQPASRRLVLLLEVTTHYQPQWLQGKPVHVFPVDSLPPRLVEEMARDMLGVTGLEPSLLQRIVQVTTGNPLLVKELVGLMSESDMIQVSGRRAVLRAQITPEQLPSTAQELLARRYARATEDVRRLLKAGALLGLSFSPLVMARLLPEQLGLHESLQKAVTLGLLKERQHEGLPVYRFRHEYIRRLALGDPTGEPLKVLSQRMRELLVSWPELWRGNRLDRASLAACLSEQPDAAAMLERAGDRLALEQGLSSCLVLYRRALELARTELRGGDGLRRRLRWKIASTLLQQGLSSNSSSILENGVDSALQSGSEPEATALLLELGAQHLLRGEVFQAEQVLRRAWPLARKGESISRFAEVERLSGRAAALQGRVDEAIHMLRSGYQRARSLEEKELILTHAHTIGVFFHQVGDYPRAFDSLRRVLVAGLEQRDADRLLSVLPDMAQLLSDAGKPELALPCFREALQLARVREDVAAEVTVLGQLAVLYLESGAAQRAYPYLKAALELSHGLNRPQLQLFLRVDSIWLKGMAGDPRQSVRELQQLLARPECLNQPLVKLRANYVGGLCQLRARELSRARESLELALKLAWDHCHAPMVARIRRAMTLLNAPASGEMRGSSA